MVARRSVAVLVGNGLSMAFNPNLRLNSITKKLVRRMGRDNDPPEEVTQAMRRIADRHSGSRQANYDDFENIVGAFLGESRTLEDLRELATLVDPDNEDLHDAITMATEFARRVRDTGTSHVLEIIFELARARESQMDDLWTMTSAIVTSFKGRVTFGNLNYDTLLLSALIHVCQSELADMGHGWRTGRIETGDGVKHRVAQLRTTLDFPSGKRVRLLHLHGSLTYWSKPNGAHFKLTTDFLDENQPWRSVRAQTTPMRPAVILANQRDKTGLVTQYPFALAYEGFEAALDRASHWLIIGYSFRDDAVNALLQKKFWEYDPVDVLVVTKGDDLERAAIERAFAWTSSMGTSRGWLAISRDGGNGMTDSRQWKRFADQES